MSSLRSAIMAFTFLILLFTTAAIAQPPSTKDPDAVTTTSRKPEPFANQVDLSPFDRLAVHTDGRLKSFESFVRGELQSITGGRTINDQSPGFTYIDLMLRPAAYANKDIIYIKNRPIRSQIIEALRSSPMTSRAADFDSRMERFRKTGLIAERFLIDPCVEALFDSLRGDLIKTAKFVDAINWALQAKHHARLAAILRVVTPPDGGVYDRWFSPREIEMASHMGRDPIMDPVLQQQISEQWRLFTDAWIDQDAHAVNAAAVNMAQLLPTINPDLYPDQSRLGWESWYFKARNMTWVWMVYLLAVIPLLVSIVYRWKYARWIGMTCFVLAFALHTFAIMLRWYVAARWPNSNMFEAVTTSAWFGGCFAILMELLLRKTPMRGIVALCSAVGSMAALMAAHFMPLQLNPNISNMMPVLHDVWLYIHVNVIIFAYCLIFMAAVSASIYLLSRLFGRSTLSDFARVGGAGSLMAPDGSGQSNLTGSFVTFGQVLDGVTMVLMEFAFVMLWAGIVMGAIWADHSWGRPWGWDPKEVFALNTFIVFVLLIHVRLRVRDKGLWTATLAMFGCAVMLFNWIIINFHLVGLHSYA